MRPEELTWIDAVVAHLHKLIAYTAQSFISQAKIFCMNNSWNDMGFEDAQQAEYDRVSEQLFTMINQALPAAVNAAA
ncbi:hypothetical protein [Pannonibacter phragmitetus]|uniref:hypothetical protein n=1 Tax=Pannonibacter phragmitetus TaxID=121719 RepID=UPI000F45874B|nr:hypothetical protein [Pannonibacter phragmitetus]MBA4206260.1 hypothetical protein [Polymorphum sp.]